MYLQVVVKIFYEVNDEKAPQNVYGKSKLDGELAVQEILDKYFIVAYFLGIWQ